MVTRPTPTRTGPAPPWLVWSGLAPSRGEAYEESTPYGPVHFTQTSTKVDLSRQDAKSIYPVGKRAARRAGTSTVQLGIRAPPVSPTRAPLIPQGYTGIS